jgi:ABC-type cobalamin/Fe3+-siderophores transport system ATPase subunit
MKFESLAFKSGSRADGTPLRLSPKRITVFIGPNNGGKSRALAELQQEISPITNYEKVVFSEAALSPIHSSEFEEMIGRLQRPKVAGEDSSLDSIALEGRGGRRVANLSLLRSAVAPGSTLNIRQYLSDNLLRYFYLHLGGTGRLDLANPVPAEPIGSVPKSTLAALFQDDVLRSELSKVVHKAFAQYLVIDPTQLPSLSYRLSTDPPANGVEKRLDLHAAEYFSKSMLITNASDGTRAFIGLLGEVVAGNPDIIFIDEPEAFLHPSLQYLLGQQIAEKAGDQKQVFVATHSPSFLLGCVLSGKDVDIVRLTHRSGSATARHLDASNIKRLMTDPLFRSVGAANALFHESAVVVEGDSDRAFYDEINLRLSRFGHGGIQHVSFLNAHNKQTAVNIVHPLRSIGIPTPFILDIDWIKEDGQVWDRYFRAMMAPLPLKESLSAARKSVRSALEAADPDYKRKGGVALLTGEERDAADQFFDTVERYGLFTVRSGELESWLPDLEIERTKSKWLPSAFDAMGSNPDDQRYLKPQEADVWQFVRRIGSWIADPQRLGMADGW